MIPFYAEELSNINVLRASISTDPTIDVAESLTVKNNVICLQDQVVADLSIVQVNISMENLVIAQPDTVTDDNDGLTPWEIKLTLPKSQQKPMHSQQADVKDWWTSKTLLDGEETRRKEIQCQHCSAAILDNSVDYKIKDLPSEHWYELVECWICHETKPEEHRARMRPILAKPNLLLVGTTYFLLHTDNIVENSIQVDSVVLERTNVNDALDIIIDRYKNPRLFSGIQQFDRRKLYFLWDRGTLTKWIAVNCTKCNNAIGEGQFCIEDGNMKLLAVKLFKYSITLLPALSELPVFTDYFVSDLVNTAKIHATHRFIIEGRQNQKIYTLIWLFNWDTNIIYNNGYVDKNSNGLKRERVIKVIYLDCRKEDDHTKKYIQLWSNDKSTDHLIYPDGVCNDLVNTLNQSTLILPAFMRKINHPAMIFTGNFSIGFIRRSD